MHTGSFELDFIFAIIICALGIALLVVLLSSWFLSLWDRNRDMWGKMGYGESAPDTRWFDEMLDRDTRLRYHYDMRNSIDRSYQPPDFLRDIDPNPTRGIGEDLKKSAENLWGGLKTLSGYDE